MIKICNVTKIYNSKKKKQHKALNNISFTIPSFGMVFVPWVKVGVVNLLYLILLVD